MANLQGKRKTFAKIMAWVMSILMAGSCGVLFVSLIIEMATK